MKYAGNSIRGIHFLESYFVPPVVSMLSIGIGMQTILWKSDTEAGDVI